MEIYQEEWDVIALIYDDGKKCMVFEQLATIKGGDKDYFVVIPFLKDKTQIKLDIPVPVSIWQGITIGGVHKMLGLEKDINIKEKVFAIFRQNSQNKYNFSANEPMKFYYKKTESTTTTTAIKVEMNQLWEKMAIKKAQMPTQTPEEIQKTAKDILELLDEVKKKMELIKKLNEYEELLLKEALSKM